jgi:hypothetical protein
MLIPIAKLLIQEVNNMGMSASAELVFGAIVRDIDPEDYQPTQFWSEENEDRIDLAERIALENGAYDPWPEVPNFDGQGYRAFDEWKIANPEWVKKSDAWYAAKSKATDGIPFEFEHFGHYDNPDGQSAVLRPREVPTIRAWTYEPEKVPALRTPDAQRLEHYTQEAKRLGLDVDFSEAAWWLTVSYG